MWAEEETDDLKYMVEHGFQRKEIAIILGKSFSDVSNHIKVLGYKSPLKNKEKDGLYFCPGCKTYKEKLEFNKDKYSFYGITTYCAKCGAKRKQESRKKKIFTEVDKHIESIQPPVKIKEEVHGDKFKQCTGCKETKSIEKFNWEKKYKKIQARCINCTRKATREYHSKRAEEKGY